MMDRWGVNNFDAVAIDTLKKYPGDWRAKE